MQHAYGASQISDTPRPVICGPVAYGNSMISPVLRHQIIHEPDTRFWVFWESSQHGYYGKSYSYFHVFQGFQNMSECTSSQIDVLRPANTRDGSSFNSVSIALINTYNCGISTSFMVKFMILNCLEFQQLWKYVFSKNSMSIATSCRIDLYTMTVHWLSRYQLFTKY